MLMLVLMLVFNNYIRCLSFLQVFVLHCVVFFPLFKVFGHVLYFKLGEQVCSHSIYNRGTFWVFII